MLIFSWIAVAFIFDLLDFASVQFGIERVESTELKVTAAEDQVTMEPSSMDFPFLNDPKTVEYIGGSKTLLLLRGPPGSGKSALAEAVFKKYRGKVAICSAEEQIPQGEKPPFSKAAEQIPQGEKPPFSKETLEQAHNDCQECVRKSCKEAFPIVIVDNTHSTLFSVKNYSGIGHEFDYVDILVAPQTSWIHDAQELFKRSSRGYPIEAIQEKLVKFQESLYPLFYGFFVNRTDSENMRSIGKMFYERCLTNSIFREEFTKHLLPDPSGKIPDPENYFSSENYTVGPVMLHCTAFFSNYGSVEQSMAYASREAVKSSNGRVFTISVIGLLVTPRSLGLRLKLNSEELLLWLADDKVDKDSTEEAASDATTSEMPSDDQCIITHLSPTCGTGSRAHFSLGSGPGVEAVQTGLDLVEIVEMEQEAVRMKRSFTIVGLEGATAVGYGEGNWMVYFDHPSSVEALFAGYF